MKTREEILIEIQSAMTMNHQMRSKCNTALSDAISLILHESKETQNNLVKEYQRGLSEAWEIARELCNLDCESGIEMFGYASADHVINTYTPLKVKQIMKECKEEELKKQVVVGDVISFEDGTKGVVMDEDDVDNIAIFTENGCIEAWTKKENVTKVDGKHVEIGDILKQI